MNSLKGSESNSNSTLLKIKAEVVVRHICGESVLIPTGKAALNNPGIISLTESGELLVTKLQDGCTMTDLVASLLDEYEVEQEQAERDVKAFVGKLEERGLL